MTSTRQWAWLPSSGVMQQVVLKCWVLNRLSQLLLNQQSGCGNCPGMPRASCQLLPSLCQPCLHDSESLLLVVSSLLLLCQMRQRWFWKSHLTPSQSLGCRNTHCHDSLLTLISVWVAPLCPLLAKPLLHRKLTWFVEVLLAAVSEQCTCLQGCTPLPRLAWCED